MNKNTKTDNHYLRVIGNGGETVVGNIPNAQYKYWKNPCQNELFSHCLGCNNENIHPEDIDICDSGQWNSLNYIDHISACEFDDDYTIEVSDENGNPIWSSNLTHFDLEKLGVNLEETLYFHYDEKGEIDCFTFRTFEEGEFYEARIDLEKPFDPKKLTILIRNANEWDFIYGIEYDGKRYDRTDFANTAVYDHIASVGNYLRNGEPLYLSS